MVCSRLLSAAMCPPLADLIFDPTCAGTGVVRSATELTNEVIDRILGSCSQRHLSNRRLTIGSRRQGVQRGRDACRSAAADALVGVRRLAQPRVGKYRQ